MLGATIDFIPAAVDIRNRAAVGSRKAAMLQRQKRYYATGRVKPGILMACRVLGVGNNTMTVRICCLRAAPEDSPTWRLRYPHG